MNKLLFLLFFTFFAKTAFPHDQTLSVCALIRDETKYLEEWIEYHRLVGVDHFYLYDNDSTDHPEKALSAYIKNGVVTLVPWPSLYNEEDEMCWTLSTQVPAYENAAKILAADSTWLVFLNVQEFLVPTKHRSIKQLLKKYHDYPGIHFTTEVFDGYSIDASFEKTLVLESDKLIIAPKESLVRKVEKTIFKPKCYTSFTWPPQTFNFKGGESPLSLNKQELTLNSYANRYKGVLSHQRERAVVDGKFLEEREKHDLLKSGVAIENAQRPVQRFLPELREKLKAGCMLQER